MEKEIRTETLRGAVTHQFYCDVCNQFLGETQEFDDGYYPKLGRFEQEIHLPDGWYCAEKTLCDTCKEEYIKTLRIALYKLGFKIERGYSSDE